MLRQLKTGKYVLIHIANVRLVSFDSLCLAQPAIIDFTSVRKPKHGNPLNQKLFSPPQTQISAQHICNGNRQIRMKFSGEKVTHGCIWEGFAVASDTSTLHTSLRLV